MQLFRWSHSLILLVSFVAILIIGCNILSTHAKNLKKTTHTLLRENRRQTQKRAGTNGVTQGALSQDCIYTNAKNDTFPIGKCSYQHRSVSTMRPWKDLDYATRVC